MALYTCAPSRAEYRISLLEFPIRLLFTREVSVSVQEQVSVRLYRLACKAPIGEPDALKSATEYILNETLDMIGILSG